jgi:hypothetical protein
MNPLGPFASRPATAALWLGVVVWTGVTLWAGGEDGATANTSRWLFPIIRWLIPDASFEARFEVLSLVRKSAHLIEYGLLALLAWAAVRASHVALLRATGLALLWVVAIAACDEFRQSLLANRTGSIRDVALDLTGGILALAVAITYTRFMQRGRSPVADP